MNVIRIIALTLLVLPLVNCRDEAAVSPTAEAVAQTPGGAATEAAGERQLGSVIFLHPDGTSASNWVALRNLDVGPDGELEWDKLPAMALYRGHMYDSLTATSNGGATAHAFGVKPWTDAFGLTGGADPKPIVDEQGRSMSVADQAMREGLSVGLVQSGSAIEPGTAVFVTAVEARKMHDRIAVQLIESGAEVLLSGGERHFLPKGVDGVHGPGDRGDDRNLIEEAKQAGYTVVRTKEELEALPNDVEKVLGLFASYHTFNDKSEEYLAQRNLPMYDPEAPSVAEMTEAALRILTAKGKRFLLVIEEEGTDNFGNKNNAAGLIEAGRRADAAIGVSRRYIAEHPDTLLITAADSDAGGMRVVGIPMRGRDEIPATLPATDRNGAPMDGVAGTGTAPFVAAPDRFGQRLPFAVVWAAHDDVSGGILVRGEGLNSERIRGSFDNTDIPRLIRFTLFGTEKP
jgi:alkaline phosphatase